MMLSRLAQGHLDTQLGGAGDRTSNLPVTSQSALSPDPHAGSGLVHSSMHGYMRNKPTLKKVERKGGIHWLPPRLGNPSDIPGPEWSPLRVICFVQAPAVWGAPFSVNGSRGGVVFIQVSAGGEVWGGLVRRQRG